MREVTSAAIPPLLIMIVALMVVTSVPALTVVPEAERRGHVTELQRQIHEAYEKGAAVQEIALPDGKAMKISECDAMTDEDAKQDCNNLFLDVTACRTKAAGQPGSDCEKK